MRRLSVVLTTLGLICAVLPIGGAASVAGTASDLEVESVLAADNKSIEISFNKALDPGLLQYVAANENAVRPFIRVSGGTPGSPDEALDGADLQTVDANVFGVDAAASNKLRVVLPEATTLSATGSYELWFDGDGTPFDELQIRAADGSSLGGTETRRSAFEGTANAAGLAEIASVEPLTSRVLRLTFRQAVLSGVPVHSYTTEPTRITVAGAPAGVRPVYIEKLPGADSTVYDIYLNGDLPAGQAYTLRVLGNPTNTQTDSAIRTTGGLAPPDAPLSGDGGFTGSGVAHSVGIESVDVGADRSQLTVRFRHKIRELSTLESWVPGEAGRSRTVVETPVSGTTGDSLTAAELGELIRIRGELEDGPGGEAVGDLGGSVRHTAAYFADRRTLVVSLAEGERLRRGTSGEVTLLADSVVDVTGATNEEAHSVGFSAPNAPLPPRSTAYDEAARDYLTVDDDQTVTFKHYAYTAVAGADGTPNYRVNAEDVTDRVVDEEVSAIVVENKYIRATFTPDYGGRMISMVYKPTGNDLLYQNPVGTPYGHGDNSPFYANWLMVWGGVAPTFSEPEHGKYWFLPWDYEIVRGKDRVTIKMTKVDTINHRQDGRFEYGATGLEIEASYTVYKDRPVVDLGVAIHNPQADSREFEYWTLTTLGPGERDPHEGSPTMEFLVPAEVIRRDPAYTWMAGVEERVHPDAPPNSEEGRELFLENMRHFSRWATGTQTGGIAYALGLADNPQGDWWGVVNHQNEEGVVRVAPSDTTPGMKFWTWGFERSFDTNPYDKGNSARPYLEPWGGTTERFFLADRLGPGETKSWTETFLPTMDMHDVTNANRHGAAHIEFAPDDRVTGYAFPTSIGGRPLQALLTDADSGRVIARKTFVPDEHASVKLTGDTGAARKLQLILKEASGRVLLTAERDR